VLGRPVESGSAPGWVSAGVALAAVAALLRTDTRNRVLAAWVVLVVGLGAGAVLAGRTVELSGSSSDQPVWLGFPFLLVQASAICAASAAGISGTISGQSFGWRQPIGLLVVAAAFVSPPHSSRRCSARSGGSRTVSPGRWTAARWIPSRCI